MQLFHGSDHIIEKPMLGLGQATNDYGLGFYCTEHIDLAREWASSPSADGIVNIYELNTNNLNILNLESPEYSVLNWLAILVNNRLVKLTSPLQQQGREYLINNFLIDISKYDLITGYRADDSYFRFVKAFLSNTISLGQLSQAMMLGDLGIQHVLKTQKAFDQLKFVSFEQVSSNTYYEKRAKRNTLAGNRFNEITKAIDLSGLFLNQIISERITRNDPRI